MRTAQGQAVHLKNYRQPEYWVKSVDLDIRLDSTQTQVRSNLGVERHKDTPPGAAMRLDGDELTLLSVSVDGKALKEEAYTETLTELIIHKTPKKKKFTVEIETQINPNANTKLMGLYQSSGNFCTQCEAEGFRRITFFPDRPDILAVYTTRLEADKKEVPLLLGNGNPVKKGSAGKGRHFAIWHDPHPKPSYLFALVGGNLGSIHKPYKTTSGRKVKLGIYVEPGKENQAHYAMDSLIRSMRWDEEVFGCEYDLDVFNIVAVSDFNMGAMENKGLNIFNDKYVLGDPNTATDADFANIEAIIAHEYFHNWTGNRITCRDWFQLCLKEGLTVYRDQEFSSDQRSRPVKRIADVKRLKASQFPEDAGPLAHPVRPQTYHEINNFYTATIYEKGAELVRMLATILGERTFRKGMDLYLKRHDGDAATIEDFIACFEKAGKIDLNQFMLWYSQAGTPVLNVSSEYNTGKKIFSVELEQVIPATPGQSRKTPHYIPQRIALFGRNGSEIIASDISGAEVKDGVAHLTKRKHKLVFKGIDQRPVLSLNRGFTAPIEINYRQSDADLAFLSSHETDAFSRWQAHQTYATRLLLATTRAFRQGKKPNLDKRFLEITLDLILNETLEDAFKAATLTLPDEGDLAQIVGNNVDPGAISKARAYVSVELGKFLEPYTDKLIKSLNISDANNLDAESAGKRAYLASLTRYGVLCKSKPALNLILKQYKSASCMTDRFNAFATIIHYHPDKKIQERTLLDFYKRYADNHIILDKWFAVQASKPSATSVSAVRKLMKHEAFSLNNPNRLRSVIGVFAMGNPTAFNVESGAGYKLVANVIKQLDGINPQVAARLLTAFRSYNSLEPNRRKLARAALDGIQAQPNLSPDVADILNRTLSG